MNRKEDYIEDLFRNNEHLLEEKPPRRAWSKLEDKLDFEKAQSSRRIYRYISTAAAVIAIVSMVSAIALFQNDAFDRNTETIAMNEKATTNQEFSVNDNASDWRKEYAPEEVESVSEADSKTATVEAETVVKDELAKEIIEPIAAAKPTPKTKDNIAKVPAKSTPKKTEIEQPVIAANGPTKEIQQAVEEEVAEVVTAPTTMQPTISETEKVTAAKRSKPNISNRPVSNSSDPAIDGRMARIETATESSNAMPQSTYSGNYDGAAAKKIKATKPVISDFHWLLGSWKNTTANGLSYEKWEITSRKSLAANGYLIQYGDTLFIEKMELKQVRSKIYYIANLNGSKTPLKFELKSLENNVATFENTKNTFPKEVILRKDGKNNFVITYEEEMNKLQEQQLQYRNDISNAKASRRMSRAGN